MVENTQTTSVDDIAHDDERLKEKAIQLLGEDVILGPQETARTDPDVVDPSVLAVLVTKHGGDGAVRVIGDTVTNIRTGPQQELGFVIIVVGSGQTCILFGSPSVRYFRRGHA